MNVETSSSATGFVSVRFAAATCAAARLNRQSTLYLTHNAGCESGATLTVAQRPVTMKSAAEAAFLVDDERAIFLLPILQATASSEDLCAVIESTSPAAATRMRAFFEQARTKSASSGVAFSLNGTESGKGVAIVRRGINAVLRVTTDRQEPLREPTLTLTSSPSMKVKVLSAATEPVPNHPDAFRMKPPSIYSGISDRRPWMVLFDFRNVPPGAYRWRLMLETEELTWTETLELAVVD